LRGLLSSTIVVAESFFRQRQEVTLMNESVLCRDGDPANHGAAE
jgi:hypothetical protein